MSEPLVTMIYPMNIAPLWNQIRPILDPAIAISGTHNSEDVYHSLMGGKSQLWVQWDEKVEAAVVTEFISYPRGLWFRFWLAGAMKETKVFWQKFYNILYDYAKHNKCSGIEDCGRGGWDYYAPHAKKIGILRRIEVNYG